MKLLKFMIRTFKGLYDIFVSYLLAFIVPFAVFAFALHVLSDVAASYFEYTDAAEMWTGVADALGVHHVFIRLAVYLPFHGVAFWALQKPLVIFRRGLERGFDYVVRAFHWLTTHFPWGRLTGEFVFSLGLTALFVPFILQPTLVPNYVSPGAWLERTANLIDGTATASIAESIVGTYRKFYAQPVVAPGVSRDQLDKMFIDVGNNASGPVVGPAPSGKQPMMDRWDPYIRKAAAGDDAKFAYIKSFMWTESGGRQYAVSHTGCSGLMQFCTGTARAEPFKSVFGTGTVYRCRCNGPCKIPRDTQKDLETGDPGAIDRQKNRFPCDMTDARFNPTKAITAGGLYVDKLRKQVSGNIYLMYIGYNSGPRVAAKVFKAGGSNPEMSLEEIATHLPGALRPHFGSSSDARARSLVRTHLPKIKKAYLTYYGT